MIDEFPPQFPEKDPPSSPAGQIIVDDHRGPCSLVFDRQVNGFVLKTPGYNEKFVAEFKRMVPDSHRKWDKNTKTWIIGVKHIAGALAAIQLVYRQEIHIHNLTQAAPLTPEPEERTFDLYYLGFPRWREVGNEEGFIALGHLHRMNLDGSIAFPLDVLTAYFGETPDYDAFQKVSPNKQAPVPVVKKNYYHILGVPKTQWFIIDTAALKVLYRKGAKLYHPDVSGEPNAEERFKAINEAWSVLGEEESRNRFDLALKVALMTLTPHGPRYTTPTQKQNSDDDLWLPPVRCGVVTVRGYPVIGRFVVTEILAWNDLTFPQGIAVTYWNSAKQRVDIDYV